MFRDLVEDINWVLLLTEDLLQNYQLPESIGIFVMSKPVSVLTWFWKLSIC